MTQQEAEALAARLTRVWQPSEVVDFGVDEDEFFYLATLSDESVALEVTGHEVPPSRFCISRTCNDGRYKARMTNEWGQVDGVSFISGPEHQDQNQFITEHLSQFRRKCWLSGCPVEATAHEKAEWIRGFPREELDVWNLKF